MALALPLDQGSKSRIYRSRVYFLSNHDSHRYFMAFHESCIFVTTHVISSNKMVDYESAFSFVSSLVITSIQSPMMCIFAVNFAVVVINFEFTSVFRENTRS